MKLRRRQFQRVRALNFDELAGAVGWVGGRGEWQRRAAAGVYVLAM